jgi:hypothetical protein
MRTFASQADLGPKKIRFPRLPKNCRAFTAEGDPKSGVILRAASDEARGIKHSRIRTAKRDREMRSAIA